MSAPVRIIAITAEELRSLIREEVEAAVEAGIPVEFRRVPGWGREVA